MKIIKIMMNMSSVSRVSYLRVSDLRRPGFAVGSVAAFIVALGGGASSPLGNEAQAADISYDASKAVPLSSIVEATSGSTGSKIVEIKSNQIAYIDKSIDVGELKINGQLHCQSSPSTAEIKARTIYVNGVFQCGTTTSRFSKKLFISLKHSDSIDPLTSATYRALIVGSGGRLNLNGLSSRIGFTRLNKTAEPGATTITLATATGSSSFKWAVGDEIVIAPSSYNPYEGEVVKIAAISASDSRVITLDRPLSYRHWGVLESYSTSRGNITLDQRAEVANLTRSIVIRSDETAFAISSADTATAQRGGHVMVHKGGYAWVDAVEFSRLGQAGIMGRYPFHWHMAGNAAGQYVRNSSIHRSFQRCLTIHETNGVEVSQNVCFDFRAHGFFLETGNEINNVISNNMAIGAKAPTSTKILLASDNPKASVSGVVTNRFPAVSAFWISHPQNTVSNNIAAGSVGTGFWMAYPPEIRVYNSSTDDYDGALLATPETTNTLNYSGNKAHSCQVGHTWDGAPNLTIYTGSGTNPYSTNNPNNKADRKLTSAHYSPPTVPVFKNLVAYKNLRTGIYFRGKTAIFENAVLADNGRSLFFAYNQILKNSTVIGRSKNHGSAEERYLYTDKRWFDKQFGIVMYDGPFELDGVDFINFPTSQISKTVDSTTRDVTNVPIASIGGARKYPNQSRRLKFTPEPYYRMFEDTRASVNSGSGWLDALSGHMLRDNDGTLTGTAGALVVANHPFIANDVCVSKSSPKSTSYTGFKICGSSSFQVVHLFLSGKQTNELPFLMVRGGKTQQVTNEEYLSHVVSSEHTAFMNKAGLIASTSDSYDMIFRKEDLDAGRLAGMRFQLSSERANQYSPVIRVLGLGSGCRLTNATAYSSRDALKNSTANAGYYTSGSAMFIKLKATSLHGIVNASSNGMAKPYVSGNYQFSCSGPVTPQVTGVIEQVKTADGTVQISGWACDYGQPSAIKVHLYVGGPAGKGTKIATASAANSSEAGVRVACASAQGNHRYVIKVPSSTMAAYKGKAIYVHGISVTGNSNLTLKNSGTFVVP